MKSTQELMVEHGAVLGALDILEQVEHALGAGDAKAREHLDQLLDFLRGFVDRCHHGKEEEVLFPELERRGVRRDGGPIGVMLAEHEVGRGHVRAMSEALARLRRGEPDAVAAVREAARAYRDLLRMHIHKENNVLFPMADQVVPESVDAELVGRFEAIERDRIGAGKHEAYHALLHRLHELYGGA